jgi:hypothetical protein
VRVMSRAGRGCGAGSLVSGSGDHEIWVEKNPLSCRKRVCHRVGNGSVIFVFFHYSLLPRLSRWRRATAFAHLFLFYPSRSFLDTTLLLSLFLPSQLQVSFLASYRPAFSNRVPARLTPFLLHVSFFSSLPSRADLLFLLLQHPPSPPPLALRARLLVRRRMSAGDSTRKPSGSSTHSGGHSPTTVRSV